MNSMTTPREWGKARVGLVPFSTCAWFSVSSSPISVRSFGNASTIARLTGSTSMLLALAACGGGGGSTDAPFVPTSGQVVKGPLSGALVWADLNSDGLQSAGEPFDLTDEFGNYSLSGVGSASIIASTGPTTVDRSAGLVLDGVTLKAPAGSSVVSPLTTIVEETGLSASAIASALGVPNVDILSATDTDQTPKKVVKRTESG
jgi:hypothetical protein